MEMGVSVVICCHNSAKRLPPTLAHLAAQQDCDGISLTLSEEAQWARMQWKLE